MIANYAQMAAISAESRCPAPPAGDAP
jgi:hypothetical protein